MKRLAIVAAYLILCAARGSAQTSEWRLAPSQAGRIYLGMTVDSLYAAYGRENVKLVDRFAEGGFTPAVQVFSASASQALIAVADIGPLCGSYRLTAISVLSPEFRTEDGLGVWSTVGEVRRKQPAAKLNREEGPSLIVEKLRMTFATSDDTFADSTRILSVWLWGSLPDSPRRCRP